MIVAVAPDLSEKDIEDLASYYSAIEIKVVSIRRQVALAAGRDRPLRTPL